MRWIRMNRQLTISLVLATLSGLVASLGYHFGLGAEVGIFAGIFTIVFVAAITYPRQ